MHFLVVLFCFFTVSFGFCQTIENVDFRAEGKTIVVRYDFVHSKIDTAINVELVFKDQQGGTIIPKTISGDLQNVKPGEGKKITWDVLTDGITLNGKYQVIVLIKIPKVVKDNNHAVLTPEPEEEVYTFVDEEAEFPGGYPAIMQFISKNYVYPPTALDMGVEGKVYIKFVVTRDGTVSSVQVERGLAGCLECDKETIRVVKLMKGWKPGKVNGKSVASAFRLPVSLNAQKDKK